MTNDLVAALREAHEFVRKRYLAMGDKEANELIAHIDAALSAASDEASGMVVYAVISNDSTDLFVSTQGAEFCQFCRKSRGIDAKIKPMIVHRDWTYGDSASRPAPSEAPNVERTTLDVQTQAERPPSVADNFSADELVWLDLVEKDDRTSPVEYPDHALITREELFAALDAARAEGIAAERERCTKIANGFAAIDNRHEEIALRIRDAIREAKP